MEVKIIEDDEGDPGDDGKIGIRVHRHHFEVVVRDVEELLELRAEIDKFLFLKARTK